MDHSLDRRALRVGRLPTGGPMGDVPFELAADLDPGGWAWAYPRQRTGSYGWETIVEEAVRIKVYDFVGHRRGRAHGKFASPHDVGSTGLAGWCAEAGVYEILDMVPPALWLTGAIGTGGYTPASPTLIMQSWSVAFPAGGLVLDQDPAGDLLIYNPSSSRPCPHAYYPVGCYIDVRWGPLGWELVQLHNPILGLP